MTTAGLVMMVISYSFIGALAVYCFFRVMTTPDIEETEHAPLDIDTKDVESE